MPAPRFIPLDALALDDDGRRVVDEVRAGRRGTVPANVVAWLPHPELARRAAHLGELVRYGTSLPSRLSELAILVVARHWSCDYEWAVHAGEAARAGVPAPVIDAIASRQVPALSDDGERAVHAFASELAARGRVGAETYERAVDALGRVAVVDLVGVIGYYTLVAFTLNAFEVPKPSGTPALPPSSDHGPLGS